jgi:outer membrane protein TolC
LYSDLPDCLKHGVALLALLCGCAGCMTPERAEREAEAAAQALATLYWQSQTGSTNALDLARPADALTLRVALLASARGEQGVVFPRIPGADFTVSTNGGVVLSLQNALCIAARNDRGYQDLKEGIFLAALNLDLARHRFESSFSGMLLSALSGNFDGEGRFDGDAEAGFSRRFESGASVAGRMAFDVARLLHDDWNSMGFRGDLSMTLPLMRGAGREIVREPLTQAERALVYAVLNFQNYRQSLSVETASDYFKVLENAQQVINAQENRERLVDNNRRAQLMFQAGRMQRIQVDQSRTDVLDAEQSLISRRRAYSSALDAFKLRIGLPPEAPVELEAGELRRLQDEMEALAAQTGAAVDAFPGREECCRIALASRHDLLVERMRVEDLERGLLIAADALRADVAVTGGVAAARRRSRGDQRFDGTESWDAEIRSDLPWERRAERNAFKRQLIRLEEGRRNLEEREDRIRLQILDGLRDLTAARLSYGNQVESVKVAELRVRSNNLFMQSGRSSMRDVLEAEDSLLRARNALVSALIAWRVSDLELRRDMGVLAVEENGLWKAMP